MLLNLVSWCRMLTLRYLTPRFPTKLLVRKLQNWFKRNVDWYKTKNNDILAFPLWIMYLTASWQVYCISGKKAVGTWIFNLPTILFRTLSIVHSVFKRKKWNIPELLYWYWRSFTSARDTWLGLEMTKSPLMVTGYIYYIFLYLLYSL